MVLSSVIMLVAIVAFYAFQIGTVLYYIKSYIQNNGIVNEEDVRKGVNSQFMSIIGLTFLSGIIAGVGTMFCILPGIYLYVPMSITFAIMVFANRDISDSISSSFKLIKDEWWNSFLSLLVILLVVFAISAVFQVPLIIYSALKGMSMSSEISFVNTEGTDWLFIILNILATIVKQLLYSVTLIGVAFIYFNLNERKNFTGTLEQIDSLGKTE